MFHLGPLKNQLGRGKLRGEKLERKTTHERLLTLGNKKGLQKGRWVGGWGNRVMGIKEDT